MDIPVRSNAIEVNYDTWQSLKNASPERFHFTTTTKYFIEPLESAPSAQMDIEEAPETRSRGDTAPGYLITNKRKRTSCTLIGKGRASTDCVGLDETRSSILRQVLLMVDHNNGVPLRSRDITKRLNQVWMQRGFSDTYVTNHVGALIRDGLLAIYDRVEE